MQEIIIIKIIIKETATPTTKTKCNKCVFIFFPKKIKFAHNALAVVYKITIIKSLPLHCIAHTHTHITLPMQTHTTAKHSHLIHRIVQKSQREGGERETNNANSITATNIHTQSKKVFASARGPIWHIGNCGFNFVFVWNGKKHKTNREKKTDTTYYTHTNNKHEFENHHTSAQCTSDVSRELSTYLDEIGVSRKRFRWNFL